jgi:hypothetical protein
MKLLDMRNDMATMRKTLSDKRWNAQLIFSIKMKKLRRVEKSRRRSAQNFLRGYFRASGEARLLECGNRFGAASAGLAVRHRRDLGGNFRAARNERQSGRNDAERRTDSAKMNRRLSGSLFMSA